MSWIRGNASSYQDLSDVLVEAATSNSVQSVDSVVAGGTGYVIGEIITLTGGTFTVAAQLEVVTLSVSAVATVRIYNAGVYTVDPTDPVAQGSTDGSGSGATFNLTLANNGWITQRDAFTQLSMVTSINSGGTGYDLYDVLTFVGGTYKTPASISVQAETGGVITSIQIEDPGDYTVLPTGVITITGGAGTGATFNVQWQAGEKEVILKGNGSGTDQIFIGWRTFSGSGYFNIELHGMTGFDANLPMDEQPGISPGFWDAISSTDQAGAYLLCQNTGVSYWLSINSSRLALVVKVGSAFFNAYLGFGNRFATSLEYPYPLCVGGHDSHPFDLSTQSKLSSGLVDPWASSDNSSAGPMFILNTDSSWLSVRNAIISTTYTPSKDLVMAPAQIPTAADSTLITPQEDRFMGTYYDFSDIIRQNVSGTPNYNVDPTPGTIAKHMMFPGVIIRSDPSQIFLELDGIFWMTAFLSSGNLLTEDRIIDGNNTYRVFQNCNRTDAFAFLAIKEQ